MENTKSRLQDIYLHLKKSGFDVYFPAQKVGECIKPYIVVRDATASQIVGLSTTVAYYDILCYIPRDMYSNMEIFVDEVKEAMCAMEPMIRPTYTQTQSFYDEKIGAHMISVQYKNYRKIV